MPTTQSLLKLEAEKCKGVPTVREKAEAILAEMNGMLRSRPFFEVHVEKRIGLSLSYVHQKHPSPRP